MLLLVSSQHLCLAALHFTSNFLSCVVGKCFPLLLLCSASVLLFLPSPPHQRSITSVFQPPAIQESYVFTLAGGAMRGKRFSCSSPDPTNPPTPHSRLSPKWLEVEEIDWKPTRLPRDEFTSALWWLFSPPPHIFLSRWWRRLPSAPHCSFLFPQAVCHLHPSVPLEGPLYISLWCPFWPNCLPYIYLGNTRCIGSLTWKSLFLRVFLLLNCF